MGEKMGRAESCIGDTILMPSDEWADMNAVSPNNRGGVRAGFFMIYVEDVDAAHDKAVKAGAGPTAR